MARYFRVSSFSPFSSSSSSESTTILSLTVLLTILTVQLFNLVDFSVGQSNKFFCDPQFCLDTESLAKCPTPRNCTTQKKTYLSPSKCNCCSNTFCIDFIAENEICPRDPHPTTEVNICGPHLTCADSSKPGDKETCVKMENTKCMQERKRYTDNFIAGTVGIAQHYPACTGIGDYAPRQCLPGSVCYCTNELGERIFGLGLPTQVMDCQCSRDLDKLQRLKKFDVSEIGIHCLDNGDYDDLQCFLRKCWCRQKPEEKNKVNITQMDKLDCYKKPLIPNPAPYLPHCEYKKAQIMVKFTESEKQYVNLLVADEPKCDWSGNYAPVQSRQDKLICVNKYGYQIENYQVDKTSPLANKIDCHCARVRQLIGNSVNSRPVCCKIGNYRRWQCSGAHCYCVDKDGKQIVTPGLEPHEVLKGEEDKLICKQESTEEDSCAY